jgi:hypothetical protein
VNTPSPRAAALLFARALRRVDQIQPTAAREPIAHMLEAGVELCATAQTLHGRPIVPVLRLAEALTTVRARWAVPEQPGPEVEQVWDAAGTRWVRVFHPDGDGWRCTDPEVDQWPVEWEDLLTNRGPLSATPPGGGAGD